MQIIHTEVEHPRTQGNIILYALYYSIIVLVEHFTTFSSLPHPWWAYIHILVAATTFALLASCQWHHKEDYWHFLECLHPNCTAAFNRLQQQLHCLCQKYSVDMHLFQLLCVWGGGGISYPFVIHFPLMNRFYCTLNLFRTFSSNNKVSTGIKFLYGHLLCSFMGF